MSVKMNMGGAIRKIEREIKKIEKKKRSAIGSAMNKETTAIRKEMVESMMTKTGLKRKEFNDRMPITRASNKSLEVRITPIYGKRVYMNIYPWAEAIARGGKKVIRLLSPIYRKNMRTGHMSKDGKRMYLRIEGERNGKKTSYSRAVRGRSVPRLFDEFKMRETYTPKLITRILAAVRGKLNE